MFFTEVFIGKIVQIYPDQGWGIIQSCRYLESKATFLLRDQRGLDKKGNIDPEKIRTTAPEKGTIVKFKIDRNRMILDGAMVFLWATEEKTLRKQHQKPGGKKLIQAHFYPRHDQYQKTPDANIVVSKEQKPAPVIAQAPVPELSSAETSAKVQDQKIADNAAQTNQPETKKFVAQETVQYPIKQPQKIAQGSGHGLPDWAAKEGVAILKDGGKIRLGVVGS
ncbi:MAG: hypothetical protein NTZ84_01700 [Candidatus Nealsonbacteria bacterium]|nr:hypothetical protein [Candidatus Nealsonbacteria bacterium]